MKKLIVLFISMIAYSQFAWAQEPGIVTSSKPGWHKIGEVKADFKTESEAITVMGKDEFKSIKLKITDAPINISKVIVYYENDATQEIPVSGSLKAGAESQTYPLKFPQEEIKKVTFTYRSESSAEGDKAHVELYGLK